MEISKFTCVWDPSSSAHSPSFQSLHLRHSSFSNPSVALPTSQLILQPFSCFIYFTAHSSTLILLPLHHRLFTYVTWRAAHGNNFISQIFKVCYCPLFLAMRWIVVLDSQQLTNTFKKCSMCKSFRHAKSVWHFVQTKASWEEPGQPQHTSVNFNSDVYTICGNTECKV